MKTLLKIRASLYGTDGQSSRLADRFADNWKRQNPGGRVVTRDLSPDAIPHLTAERYQAFNTPAENRTPEQQALIDLSDTLIAELEAADVIVLAAPMYNFSVPSTLRAYFDHIARVGVTFRYTAAGPEGLLTDKKVYAFVTRGGQYAGNADTQTPYLKQFLGFLGLTDIEFVLAEGMAMADETRERSLVSARAIIDGLTQTVAAA